MVWSGHYGGNAGKSKTNQRDVVEPLHSSRASLTLRQEIEKGERAVDSTV